MHLAHMTSTELVTQLTTDGTLTDREALLLERLVLALDEIDRLTEELGREQERKEPPNADA